jgi:hypothetical protein
MRCSSAGAERKEKKIKQSGKLKAECKMNAGRICMRGFRLHKRRTTTHRLETRETPEVVQKHQNRIRDLIARASGDILAAMARDQQWLAAKKPAHIYGRKA